MKNAWSGQLDLFAQAVRPLELSQDERLKVVALLQSLLVEAAAADPGIRNPKEAADDEDHA